MCGLSIIGAFISGAGSLVSGMMQAQQYEAQAAQQERQAEIERDKGIWESNRQRERHRTLSGNQRAQYLAQGVSLEGTPTDVIIDSTAENEIDVEAIKYGAQIKEDNYRFSAQMSRMNASSASFGGFVGALSPLIGGMKSFGGTSLSSGFA